MLGQYLTVRMLVICLAPATLFVPAKAQQSPSREYVRLGGRVLAIEPNVCGFSLAPANRLFPATASSSTATVSADAACGWLATSDTPWLTVSSPNGTGNGAFGYSAGTNTATARLAAVTAGGQSFKVMQNGSSSVTVFDDVASSSPYFDYVSLMKSNNITAGCSITPPLYCPASPVTRGQMAVFIVVALDIALGTSGTWTVSQTPYFSDVLPTGPTAGIFPFVQRIRDLGITGGCGVNPPIYCPNTSITQGQMAVFMIASWMKANGLGGFTYSTTPFFTDVPSTHPFFRFVQKMRDMGFNTGCGPALYCPDTAVTRGDMAPMIMRSILGSP